MEPYCGVFNEFLWCPAGHPFATCRFSLAVVRGLLLRWLLLCDPRSQGARLGGVVHRKGLAQVPMACGISQLRDQTYVPLPGRWIPNHWTTKKSDLLHLPKTQTWAEPRLTKRSRVGQAMPDMAQDLVSDGGSGRRISQGRPRFTAWAVVPTDSP